MKVILTIYMPKHSFFVIYYRFPFWETTHKIQVLSLVSESLRTT
jgi:hypothetical protein